MAAPTIGRRRRWATAGQVDLGHPLAQSLEFCVLPGVNPHDIAKGYESTKSGSPSASATPFGPAMLLASATSDNLIFASPDAPFLGAITIMWVGRFTSASAFRQMAGKCATNGADFTPFQLISDNSASPLKLTFSRATSAATVGNYQFTTTSGCLPINTDLVVFASSPDGSVRTAPTMIVNGVSYASTGTGSGNGACAGASASIRLGRRPDNAVQMNGPVNAVMIWSRQLSMAEMAELTADPFCFIRF